MSWLRLAVVCCAVVMTLMTSQVSCGKRDYFHGYGGPTIHFVKHANTRHYYGLGHAISYYPPYRSEGKKGGRRRGGGKKRGGGDSIIIVQDGGHGGYGGHGGHGGGYDDFDYYDDLY